MVERIIENKLLGMPHVRLAANIMKQVAARIHDRAARGDLDELLEDRATRLSADAIEFELDYPSVVRETKIGWSVTEVHFAVDSSIRGGHMDLQTFHVAVQLIDFDLVRNLGRGNRWDIARVKVFYPFREDCDWSKELGLPEREYAGLVHVAQIEGSSEIMVRTVLAGGQSIEALNSPNCRKVATLPFGCAKTYVDAQRKAAQGKRSAEEVGGRLGYSDGRFSILIGK